MTSALIKGGLLGGLIVFAWSAISWMVLPWHTASLRNFTNEDAVVQALQANVPESGVYVIPGVQNTGATEAEKKANQDRMMKRMETGPFLYASFQTEGMNSTAMGTRYIIHFLTQIIAAMLITWLLLKMPGLTFMGRTGVVVVIALIGGIMYELPMLIFWHFPLGHTLVNLIDSLIGWFLAGLVIAKFATSPAPARV
jgi:hypothetical protein